ARMLHFPDGPSVELFHYSTPAQQPGARPCDLGLQHIGLYTDDIDAACVRILAAGGQVLRGPLESRNSFEAGPGNKWCYTRTPWGPTIELVTFPSPARSESMAHERRWHPRAVESSSD